MSKDANEASLRKIKDHLSQIIRHPTDEANVLKHTFLASQELNRFQTETKGALTKGTLWNRFLAIFNR